MISYSYIKQKQEITSLFSKLQLQLDNEAVSIGHLTANIEFFAPNLEELQSVYQFGAVTSRAKQLVNNGCYLHLDKFYCGPKVW